MAQQGIGLYICYWSLMDPLCQTQSLAYLRQLTARGGRVVLLTFEQPRFRLSAGETVAMRRELAGQGIVWYPLTYHKRFPLLATGYDCLAGVLTGIYAAWRHRPAVVHSRGSIPAAMALALNRLCRLAFLYDADSRLSLEYADNGHWSRQSLSYRLTALVESWSRRRADSIVVLTERLRHDFLEQFHVRAPVEVIPCCVDTAQFHFDLPGRLLRRRQLGLEDQKLLLYVGKVGARYLVQETFRFLSAVRETIQDARLLILSPDPPARFEAIAQSQGIGPEEYVIVRAGRYEVPSWLSAADVGLALIRSAECERGSSPVKIGEYLATGLPVVVTDGIGDYSDLVEREGVGLVLKGFDAGAFQDAVGCLQELWKEGDLLRRRCRTVAEKAVSLETVGFSRYSAVYNHLLEEK
jgi:glycosyltransferase involved in cell wall biosynthesis